MRTESWTTYGDIHSELQLRLAKKCRDSARILLLHSNDVKHDIVYTAGESPCPNPPQVWNATMTRDTSTRNTTVTYRCLRGWRFTDGNYSKTIQCDGTNWTPDYELDSLECVGRSAHWVPIVRSFYSNKVDAIIFELQLKCRRSVAGLYIDQAFWGFHSMQCKKNTQRPRVLWWFITNSM